MGKELLGSSVGEITWLKSGGGNFSSNASNATPLEHDH
jgi:hypothetical protein